MDISNSIFSIDQTKTTLEIDLWHNPLTIMKLGAYYEDYYQDTDKGEFRFKNWREPGLDDTKIEPVNRLVEELIKKRLIASPAQCTMESLVRYYPKDLVRNRGFGAMKLWRFRTSLEQSWDLEKLMIALWNSVYHEDYQQYKEGQEGPENDSIGIVYTLITSDGKRTTYWAPLLRIMTQLKQEKPELDIVKL